MLGCHGDYLHLASSAHDSFYHTMGVYCCSLTVVVRFLPDDHRVLCVV